ncbi:hypothetical protein GP486_006157 [Trichoglossum hirsutum]|uniref:Protein kinase domain-containing protein n=1 Tax=Trichoglossum hirsutum TaxID=265104 RepID=A0A9P8L7V9_9PEZI|nr:hypothetical protein GP486_006157 [Trichoglossum hirsutum]
MSILIGLEASMQRIAYYITFIMSLAFLGFDRQLYYNEHGYVAHLFVGKGDKDHMQSDLLKKLDSDGSCLLEKLNRLAADHGWVPNELEALRDECDGFFSVTAGAIHFKDLGPRTESHVVQTLKQSTATFSATSTVLTRLDTGLAANLWDADNRKELESHCSNISMCREELALAFGIHKRDHKRYEISTQVPYRHIRQIGSGAMGLADVVYCTGHSTPTRIFARKQIQLRRRNVVLLEMIKKEVESLKKLKHRNIVRKHTRIGLFFAIIMEPVGSCDLREWMNHAADSDFPNFHLAVVPD